MLYFNLPCSMAVNWGRTTAGNLQWILLLQKRAMRILNSLQYDESCRGKCCVFSIMTVIAFCVWEIALHHTAEKIYKEALRCLDTRHSSKCHLLLHHSAIWEETFKHRAEDSRPTTWRNENQERGKQLKTALNNRLINHQFNN